MNFVTFVTCIGVSLTGDVRLPAHIMYSVSVVALKGLCTVIPSSPEVTGWWSIFSHLAVGLLDMV